MTRFSRFPLLLGLVLVACEQPAPEVAPDAPPTRVVGPASVTFEGGFATPESALHDPDADVYLVSNINGDPLGKDGNGFLSRVRPDGEIEALRWVDGASEGVTLHAPKGLALKGDTVFVADIDTVRAFHRTSGEPLGAIGVPGATFLNGLAVGADGTLYVSDSGLTTGFEPSGTDAVYAIRDGRVEPIASGEALARPNGLAVHGEDVYMVPFGGNAVVRLRAGRDPEPIAELPGDQLDGLVRLDDGSFLVSSWGRQAVYRLFPDGRVETVVEDVQAPADIGFDAGRGLVLIPLFMDDRVEAAQVR